MTEKNKRRKQQNMFGKKFWSERCLSDKIGLLRIRDGKVSVGGGC